MPKKQIACDVAVVGAGPVGDCLAALLGQAGSRVFIGEASKTIYPLPRAAHFDHEIMRVFQQLGITEAIADAITPADRYVFQNAAGDVLLDFDLSVPAETGWGGYMLYQPAIEEALRDRLEGDPNVELATGVTFLRFEQMSNGIVSTWLDGDDEFEVRSRFLVGCDGAWSPVREGAGLKYEDLSFDEPWLVLDVEVEADNGLPKVNTQYCDPSRPTTYVFMGGERRRRFEFMLKPGETADEMLRDEAIADLLRPWDTRGVAKVDRKAVYRFHALVAEHWRKDDVVIAGDAAHQMPPFAGQGMCSGIRDAAALAWRLPLAMTSGSPEHLLDSYQAERDPHVRAITGAAIATGRVVCTLDPEMAAGRDAQMLAAKAAGAPMPDISSPPLKVVFGLPDTTRAGEQFFQPAVTDADGSVERMDDVLGPGAWLIVDANSNLKIGEAPGVRTVRTDDALITRYKGAVEGWLAQAWTAAVLVRADRYVFGTGTPEALISAYRDQAGLPM